MTQRSSRSTIDIDELRSALAGGQPVVVLDVRSTADRAEWSIPGSLHVDAYEALKGGSPGALAAANIPMDAQVVTVCGAGQTSLKAMEHLRARGYDARSLAGGMKAWSLAWNCAETAAPGGTATIVQVRRTGKGCLSYVIGDSGEAVVIDASLSPEIYETLAGERGWKIRHVLDTHVHADHLSRSPLLAACTGATLHLPAQDRVTFAFEPVGDEDDIAFGSSRLVSLRTPGHTRESTCYLLDGRSVFTGDTLFLTGVGRPDLEANPDEALARARLLRASLGRLMAMPAETRVFPGHTSEPIPFDERPIVASVGEIADRVEMLQLPEEAFAAAILSRIPPAPANHARIVALNETGILPAGDLTDLEAGANRCAVS